MSLHHRVGLRAVAILVATGMLLAVTSSAAYARSPRKADLAVVGITGTADPVQLGQHVFVFMQVANAGPANATGVTLTIDVPPSLQADESTLCTGTTTLTCAIGSLPAGLGASVTLGFTAVLEGTGQFTATVVADQRDPVRANNVAVATVTVTNSVDLALTLADATGTAGQPFFFSIGVANFGPGQAGGVTVTVDFPAGLTPTSLDVCQASGAGWRCVYPFPSLPPSTGVSAPVSLQATVAGTYQVEGTVTATTTDPDLTNNADAAAVTVHPAA
jgi:hypothetical protein